MAYKKYFNINGKRYGPYYYESYRDETGKVRKRYIRLDKIKDIKKNPKPEEKKKIQQKKNKERLEKDHFENKISFGTIFLDRLGFIRVKYKR